jgi:hypothetical protein
LLDCRRTAAIQDALLLVLKVWVVTVPWGCWFN